MAENFFHYGRMRPSLSLNIKFVQQPPNDLRKANFFHFSIAVNTTNGPVHVEKARFESFIHEDDTRNGCLYSVRLRHQNGSEEKRYLYLTLVDAATFDPIRYEGHDDSPRMQRVFLTHEAICSRCQQGKSCGNKSETPSDPRIIDRGVLQFHLRCNQNCLKGAGNPRDMRRFALAFSFEDSTRDKSKIAALSKKIFVHNNSKHSKKRKKEGSNQESETDQFEPIYVHPRVGTIDSVFIFHSREWCKPGVVFRCQGMELVITSMVLNVAMTVQLPHWLHPGPVLVSLFHNNALVFTFPYEVQSKMQEEIRPYVLNGFLVLQRRGTNNISQVDLGPDHSVVYVIEGTDNPGYNFQNYAAQPTPWSQPQIHLHHPPNYPPPNSSSSSLSPNGSHFSGENSNSPVGFFPTEGY